MKNWQFALCAEIREMKLHSFSKLSPKTSISLFTCSFMPADRYHTVRWQTDLAHVCRYSYRHIKQCFWQDFFIYFFFKLSRLDIKHRSPLNLPIRKTCSHTDTISNQALWKFCQCKKLQTYENRPEQFPHIMIHLEQPQHYPNPPPPFFFSSPWAGHCSVSSLPVTQFQVLSPTSAPPRDLSTHSCPRPSFVLPFSKLFRHVPFASPPLPPSPPPPLVCLVYTRLLACPLSFQPLKAFQAANKRQVPTTTKGLSAAFE